MLKVVHPICYGMDIHKSFIVACIAATNSVVVIVYKSKRFSTFTGDLRRCADWLAVNNCKDVCTESTGNTGFLFTIFLKPPAILFFPNLNILRIFAIRKTDKKC